MNTCVFCTPEHDLNPEFFLDNPTTNTAICSTHVAAVIYSVIEVKPGWLEKLITIDQDKLLVDTALKLAMATLNSADSGEYENDLADQVLHAIAERGK